MLITVLFSRTQPLIRYEMSDQVRVATVPCPCGRPYACLETIEGRAEEVLQLLARSGGRVAVHPNVFHDVLERMPVTAWQVVERADSLTVLVSGVGQAFSETNVREALQQRLAQQGVRNC